MCSRRSKKEEGWIGRPKLGMDWRKKLEIKTKVKFNTKLKFNNTKIFPRNKSLYIIMGTGKKFPIMDFALQNQFQNVFPQ
jgi:hypothetical protein